MINKIPRIHISMIIKIIIIIIIKIIFKINKM